MRVLLDECVPRKLKSRLVGHECRTVPEEGLAGKKNGELLRLPDEAGLEVFLTLDRGIEFQQNLQTRRVAVLVVHAASSRLSDLLPHVPEILKRLESVLPSGVMRVGW
jgi:hypothetical protein